MVENENLYSNITNPHEPNPSGSEVDEAMHWAAGGDPELLVHHYALSEVDRLYHGPNAEMTVTDYWHHKDQLIDLIQKRREELGLPPFPFES